MKKLITTLTLLLLAVVSVQAHNFVDEWAKFNSSEGRFSVMLPGKPEESIDKQNSQHGPYTVHIFTAKAPGEVFLVGWVDYDPNFNFNSQKELEANRDNFVKGLKATILGTTPITLGANPGIEFTAENDTAFFRSRVYIVGRRPYQLISVRLKGAQDSPNVAKFFSSFQIVPAG